MTPGAGLRVRVADITDVADRVKRFRFVAADGARLPAFSGGAHITVMLHTPERLIARKDIVAALEQGRTSLGLRLKLTPAQHDALIADASGDRLDAVLCLLQAAWAGGRDDWGLPAGFDPVEGWIVGARAPES